MPRKAPTMLLGMIKELICYIFYTKWLDRALLLEEKQVLPKFHPGAAVQVRKAKSSKCSWFRVRCRSTCVFVPTE